MSKDRTGAVVLLAGAMLITPALVGPAFAVPTHAAAPAAAPSRDMATALRLFPQYKAVQDSRKSTAPVILTGRVTTPAGKPMAGAAVLLEAWPSPDQMHDLPIGGTVDTVPIARTVTRADGTYTLRVKRSAKLDDRLDHRRLDVDFDIVQGRYAYHWAGQAVAAKTGKRWARTTIDIHTSKQTRLRIPDRY